jgi:hypothetical protein
VKPYTPAWWGRANKRTNHAINHGYNSAFRCTWSSRRHTAIRRHVPTRSVNADHLRTGRPYNRRTNKRITRVTARRLYCAPTFEPDERGGRASPIRPEPCDPPVSPPAIGGWTWLETGANCIPPGRAWRVIAEHQGGHGLLDLPADQGDRRSPARGASAMADGSAATSTIRPSLQASAARGLVGPHGDVAGGEVLTADIPAG